MTTWVLYLIVGTLSPSLEHVSKYTDEAVCRKAVKELQDNKLKSVCLPKQVEK
jgi:hypothetical protein